MGGLVVHARRHAAVPCAVFCRQGRDGCAGCVVLDRTGALGIESTSMVPGAFTKGTNHFAHSGEPADADVAAEYENGPYAGVTEQALKGLTSLEPSDADPVQVAREIINVVNLPFGNGRSACTSICPRTALKWSRWWRTGCAARCTSQSACRICFRRRSAANSKVSRRTIRVEFCIGERAPADSP